MSFPRSHSLLIYFFCFLAALRVAFFSAAFPFFNNVDEEAHFDLVVKYCEGRVPTSLEKFSPTSLRYISQYSSPEFFFKTSDFPENKLPVAYKFASEDESVKRVNESYEYWSKITNHESSQSPLYYWIAGAWFKFGKFIGLAEITGILPVYFIRFLNIFLIAALVWISYKIILKTYPGNKLLLFGVPLFVAIIPQDIFYSIQNDVLSPVFYGLAILWMIGFLQAGIPRERQCFFAGSMIGMTVVVKTSNLPLFILGLMFFLIKVWNISQNGQLKQFRMPSLAFLSGIFLPVVLLCFWNLSHFGDLTGSKEKIAVLGWGYKPISEWFNNKLFSFTGFIDFWNELFASFWRGEFAWSRERLAIKAVDLFYSISSIIFLVAACFTGFRKINRQKSVSYLILMSVVFLFLFVVFLSLYFDFSSSPYPSADKPYFTSGRLMSAVIIPFLILYIRGFEIIFFWIRRFEIKMGLLILLALGITISEVIINRVAIASDYNLFSYF